MSNHFNKVDTSLLQHYKITSFHKMYGNVKAGTLITVLDDPYKSDIPRPTKETIEKWYEECFKLYVYFGIIDTRYIQPIIREIKTNNL